MSEGSQGQKRTQLDQTDNIGISEQQAREASDLTSTQHRQLQQIHSSSGGVGQVPAPLPSYIPDVRLYVQHLVSEDQCAARDRIKQIGLFCRTFHFFNRN